MVYVGHAAPSSLFHGLDLRASLTLCKKSVSQSVGVEVGVRGWVGGGVGSFPVA